MQQLLESIAETTEDYRKYEAGIPNMTPQHVQKWINQFGEAVQVPILEEIDYIFKKTYFSKNHVENFLTDLSINNDIASDGHANFWENSSFLNIQSNGRSQKELLKLFDKTLERKFGFDTSQCNTNPDISRYIYLDDILFSGGHVMQDISAWIETDAPEVSELHIILMAFHEYGSFYSKKEIIKKIENSSKKIDLKFSKTFDISIEIEDRKAYTKDSDVLRPSHIPDDEAVKAYADGLGRPLALREGANIGKLKLFSNAEKRNILEQEFLKAGTKIRDIAPNLIEFQRPLGNMVLDTLGFGSLFVTYRNCPNNCPLALWVGSPWYPLFPRLIN